MADATYNQTNYRQQGAARWVIGSGGSLDVESGGELDIESGGSLKIAGTAVASTAAELDQRALHFQLTLGTADTQYLVIPWACTLTTAYSVIDQALTTADETLTINNNAGTGMTGGVITITQSGSAAGDIDTVSPSANNTFTAGQKLEVDVGGENGTAARCDVTFLVTIT